MTIIFTDGSCPKNGREDAKGGFGVVVCEGEPNSSPDTYKVIDCYQERAEATTNNRMELSAIIWALRKYGSDGFFVPIVYSDSMYSINSLTTWIHNWKMRGWTRAKGPLENVDLMKEWDDLTTNKGLKIDLRYVKGHADSLWNNIADGLATGHMTTEEVMSEYGK